MPEAKKRNRINFLITFSKLNYDFIPNNAFNHRTQRKTIRRNGEIISPSSPFLLNLFCFCLSLCLCVSVVKIRFLFFYLLLFGKVPHTPLPNGSTRSLHPLHSSLIYSTAICLYKNLQQF